MVRLTFGFIHNLKYWLLDNSIMYNFGLMTQFYFQYLCRSVNCQSTCVLFVIKRYNLISNWKDRKLYFFSSEHMTSIT